MRQKLIDELTRRIPGRERIRPGLECEDVADLLAPLPYENLSKFLALLTDTHDPHLRMGEEVLEDHLAHGLGGTCFSLTQTAYEIFTHLGVPSTRITGSMKAGREIHSALIVHSDTGPDRIYDPGYLLPFPLPITPERGNPSRGRWGGKLYTLTESEEGLHLSIDGEEKVVYHPSPPDDAPFFNAWHKSFSLMKDLIVTRREGERMDYLRNTFFRRTLNGNREQRHIKENPSQIIAALFGLDPEIVEKALILYQESHPWKKVIRNR